MDKAEKECYNNLLLVYPQWVEGSSMVSQTLEVDQEEYKITSKTLHQSTSNGKASRSTMWSNLENVIASDTGISTEAATKIIGSLRPSTRKQYSVYIEKLLKFYDASDLHKVSPVNLINFLESLYITGIGYSALNTARSAVSTYLGTLTLAHKSIGTHSLLCRYMKGVFNARPTLPRHCDIFDPDVILHVLNYDSTENECLLELSRKLVTLLTLLSEQRVATIAIAVGSLVKQSKAKISPKASSVLSLRNQEFACGHLHDETLY